MAVLRAAAMTWADDPVGLENSAPCSELGLHWQRDKDPVLRLNTFKLLS